MKRNYRSRKNLYQFHKNLFSDDIPSSKKNISANLKDLISLPKRSLEQSQLCEGKFTVKEVKDALNKMKNNNHGLTKEFFETSWVEIKSLL